MRAEQARAQGDHAVATDPALKPDGSIPSNVHLTDLFVEVQRRLKAKQGAEALPFLREILKRHPDHPDALNLTSVAFGQVGLLEDAERFSRQAVELRPDDVGFQLNLANRLRDRGALTAAVAVYRKALDLSPEHPELLRGIVSCLAESNRCRDAAPYAERLASVARQQPHILALCAKVMIVAGESRKSLDFYEQAIALDGSEIEWQLQAARLCMKLDKLQRATALAEGILEQEDHHEARSMYASALLRFKEYERMVPLLDGIPDDSDQAANAANLTGMMLVAQAQVAEGLAVMGKVEDLAPMAFPLQATRLMYLNYDPDMSSAALFEAHVANGEAFAAVAPSIIHRTIPDLDPNRRLTIGYVSPDFRAHSVAYFAMPYFRAFDRRHFDVIAYASAPHADEVTDQLRCLATAWHDVFDLDDQQLAQRIHDDRVDILIDLAGLTRNTRLLAFAARPAPLQMSYIGYPNTTGFPSIDYRITDGITDPDGADDHYTETLIRLPRCFLCYAVPTFAPDVGPPPHERNGYVTFGSFNNFAKVNRKVLDLWSGVLAAVPSSRLLLKAAGSSNETTQRVIRGHLGDKGIDPERIRFAAYTSGPGDHLAVYNEVDLALDTFPYNGTTTTCEALWMGVPVVTLAGDRHASRVGMSLLTAVNFQAGVATSPDDYVLTARLLAEQPQLLTTLRRNLRTGMAHSPLVDNHGHARALEEAFREVWRIHCAQQPE